LPTGARPLQAKTYKDLPHGVPITIVNAELLTLPEGVATLVGFPERLSQDGLSVSAKRVLCCSA
jgi:hypothetical protein